MKIVSTSSYKTYFKNNTKNYITNYYVLVFLISVIFLFVYNIGRREYLLLENRQECGSLLTSHGLQFAITTTKGIDVDVTK